MELQICSAEELDMVEFRKKKKEDEDNNKISKIGKRKENQKKKCRMYIVQRN